MNQLFRLKIVSKRQATIPQRLMDILGLSQGDELQVHVSGNRIWLEPYHSTPEDQVSEDETAAMDEAEQKFAQGKTRLASPEEIFGKLPEAQPEIEFQPTPVEYPTPYYQVGSRGRFLDRRRPRGRGWFRPSEPAFGRNLGMRPIAMDDDFDWLEPNLTVDSAPALEPRCQVAPRNFRRDDNMIFDSVGEALSRHGLDVSNVEVHVKSGVVQLSGTISTRRQRLLAEDVASRVLGVQDVKNNIEVRGKAAENVG